LYAAATATASFAEHNGRSIVEESQQQQGFVIVVVVVIKQQLTKTMGFCE